MESLFHRDRKFRAKAATLAGAALLWLNACSKPAAPAAVEAGPAKAESPAKPMVKESDPEPALAVEIPATLAPEPALPPNVLVQATDFAPAAAAPGSFDGKTLGVPAVDESQPYHDAETPQTRFTARVQAMKEMRLEQAQQK